MQNHVEDNARFFRHPARVPGRVPDHALTSTFPTPGTGRNCGQLGEVSDMSTFTVWSSAISMR